MVGDDLNHTQMQLDSIRARKPKFICVNDDMDTAPPETREALHLFYEALFPLSSQFELPEGQKNSELHWDVLRKRDTFLNRLQTGGFNLVFVFLGAAVTIAIAFKTTRITATS